MTASFPGSVKNFTDLVDGVDEMEAANVNDAYAEIEAIESELAAELLRGGYASTETLADTLALADTDPALQYLDPGGAARDVTLPAERDANHLFVIVNTADAAETITVKDDGANTIGTVAQGEVKIFVSNSVAWKVVSGGGSSLSKASAADVTAGTDDDKYTTSKALRDAGISAGRELLTGNRTYYVRADGNDSNTGLANTSGGAFLTIQKAIDVIAANLDIAGYTVTVQVGDGTYTGAVALKNVIGYAAPGNLVIQGNSGTPTNVIISTTSNTCFFADGITSVWDIKNLRVKTTTSGNCLYAINGSLIRFTGIDFNVCADAHICAFNYGRLEAIGDYSISGGATNHYYAKYGSFIYVSSRTITVTANVSIGTFANIDGLGSLRAIGNTYTLGAYAVTGQRYNINNNAVCFTYGGANYFPGNSPGAAATGGLYV